MPAPHRVVDEVADGLANGVDGVGNSLIGTAQSLGKNVMGALDKPFQAITNKEGPHRIIDRVADGAASTVRNIGSQGVVGSAKVAGESVMSALDQPVEEIGIPPKLEGLGVSGLGKIFK